MTIEDAARELGLAPVTLRAQAQRGVLEATKVGRDWVVTRAAVDAYRDRHLGRRRKGAHDDPG